MDGRVKPGHDEVLMLCSFFPGETQTLRSRFIADFVANTP